MRVRNYLQSVILLFAVLRVCSSEAEVMAVFHESYRHDPVIEIAIDNYIQSAEDKGHKIIIVFTPTQTITELKADIYNTLSSQNVDFKYISGINFYGPVLSTRVNLNPKQVSGYSLFRLRNLIYELQASDDVVSVKNNQLFDIVRWVSHQSFKSNQELANHLTKSSKNIAPDKSMNLGIQHLKDFEENIRQCAMPYFVEASKDVRNESIILFQGLLWYSVYGILSSPKLADPNLPYYTQIVKKIAMSASYIAAVCYYIPSFLLKFGGRWLQGGKKLNPKDFCRDFIIPVMNNDGLLKTIQNNNQGQ